MPPRRKVAALTAVNQAPLLPKPPVDHELPAVNADALEVEAGESDESVDETETNGVDAGDKRKRTGGTGKRRINMEYVKDKAKRTITFTKRKAGIFTKARELATLTGASLLLVVVSEGGTVFSFASDKLQPLVSQAPGLNLISACLNGTVAVEPAEIGKPVVHPKGGEIILRDAFSREKDSKKPSTSTLPVLPPMPIPLPDYATKPMSRSYSYSHYELKPDYEHPQWQGPVAGPSHRPIIHSAPLMQMPFEEISRPSDSPELWKEPEEQRVEQSTSRLPPLPPGLERPTSDIPVDDVNEEECARRMSRLRRSLSVEKRFEESDDTGRAYPSGPTTNGGNHQHDGRHEDDTTSTEPRDQASGTSAYSGARTSYADTADAWSRVREQFFGSIGAND